jgi:hypothetical protein
MPAGRIPAEWDLELHDPAAIALGILAQRADPAASAELLGDARIWETALARTWPDDGLALRDIVALAGHEPGTAGARAVRNGLVVMGAGLVEGDPADRTVHRMTVAIVSPALALGVAAHPAVVGNALAASADGELATYSRDVLRGLGIVTEDRVGARLIGRALDAWTADQPPVNACVPPLGVAVHTAYLAAQEYGQRLPFALDQDERREAAENAKWFWDHTVGLLAETVPGPVLGTSVRVGVDYLAIAAGADGTYENGVDTGLHFGKQEALESALLAMFPDALVERDAVMEVQRQALGAFDGSLRVLDPPEATMSEETDWRAPLEDVLVDIAGIGLDRVGEAAGNVGRAARPHD